MKDTFLKNILSSFSFLSIDSLRLYLKDDYTYQSASKETFLSKFEEIFISLKNCGDTELLIFEGQCVGQTCSNCGKKGYRFVGNRSKNYFDLIFETESDYIKDIFSCEQFETDNGIEGLQTKSSIYINLDEEASFNGNTEYWTRVYAAASAYSEVITSPPKMMDFWELSYWLDKHADLNSMIGDYSLLKPILKWTDFSLLYSELLEIRLSVTKNLNQIVEANLFRETIKSEEEIIAWLIKYEDMFEEISLDLRCSVLYGTGQNLSYHERIIFTGDEFSLTIAFIDFFLDHQSEMLKKYSTYTRKEEEELIHDQALPFDDNHSSSLKFHIQKRKELEEFGISIPLFINNPHEATE